MLRNHKKLAVAIVVGMVLFAAPLFAVALTQTLGGGDTLSVTCQGAALTPTQVNPTRVDLDCTPNTTTTTTSTTTTVPTTTVPTTTVPPGSVFSEGFANLNNWSFAHFAYEIPVRSNDPSTATISSGRAKIEAFDQNYGDAALRSAVKYNLTNGGTVTLDMSDDSGGMPLIGFAYISFSANPDNAKASMADERAEAYSPANLPTDALQIQLRDNCRIPWGPPVAVRYKTNLPGGRTTQRGSWCNATPDGRYRLVFTPGHVSIRNGANVEMIAYDVTIPPTGWVIVGVHNHASLKYGGGPAVTGLFDNVTYPV